MSEYSDGSHLPKDEITRTLPSIENKDSIVVDDGSQAMCDGEEDTILEFLADGLLDSIQNYI